MRAGVIEQGRTHVRRIPHSFPGCLSATVVYSTLARVFFRRSDETVRFRPLDQSNGGTTPCTRRGPFHPFRPTRSFSSDTSTSSGGFAGCASVAAPFARLLRQCAVRRRSRTTCYCVVWTCAVGLSFARLLHTHTHPLCQPRDPFRRKNYTNQQRAVNNLGSINAFHPAHQRSL